MKKHLLYKILFAVVAFCFTSFVFLNTYEVVFNKDVAFAQSVTRYHAGHVIDTAIKDFDIAISSETSDAHPALDGMDRIEFPAIKAQVELEEARKVEGKWYQRPSAMHFIGLNKNQYNVTVDYLLYTTKSWRTIPLPERIEQGMEAHIYYGNGAVSSFEVAEKKVLPLDKSLLVGKSEDRQVLLVVHDSDNNVYYGYSLVLKR